MSQLAVTTEKKSLDGTETSAGCTGFTCEEIQRQSAGNQTFRKLHPGVLVNLQALLYTSYRNTQTERKDMN